MKLINYCSIFFISLVLTLVSGCETTRQGMDLSSETTGQYVDDSVITSKVKAALLDEPTLSSNEISVETYKGKVQLSGFVNSQADINRAVQVARNVEGVKSVKNDMALKSSRR